MDQLFPNTPFVVPFPPVPPNYIDSPSRAPLMIAIGIAFCSMSFIFVAFRIYTRWFITKRVYIEDWLSVVAWALSVFYVVCNALSVKQGVGRHWWDIPFHDLFVTPKFNGVYFTGLTYWIAMLLIKMIILLLLHRLTPSLKFRRWIYAAALFILSSSISAGLACSFPCINPVTASWRVEDRSFAPNLKCINFDVLLKVISIFNLLGDLICLIIPVCIIMSSQMSTRKKTHVLIVFILGGVASILAVVRIYVTYETQRPESLVDYNWAAAKLMTLSTVEMNIGVICCCLPAVKQGLAYFVPSVFGSFSSMTPSEKTNPRDSEELGRMNGGSSVDRLDMRDTRRKPDSEVGVNDVGSSSDLTIVGDDEAPDAANRV